MVAEALSSAVLSQENSEHGSGPYTYSPLSKGQIRVLELSPASQETDQLRGNLLVTSLEELPPRRKPFSSDVAEPIDPTKHVCFEAISYVWGEAIFTESFITTDGFIRITPSLASILRRLRHHEKPRLYWADGLCINQNDIAEKEIQVPLMGIVYSSAVRVLCDICEESQDIDLLLGVMDRYWKKNIRRGCQLNQGPSLTISKETTAAIMGVQLPTQEEADGIEDCEPGEWADEFLEFISSPWFHRLWIFQEFVLARDVSMIFGRRYLPWGEIYASTVNYVDTAIPWDSLEFAKPENSTKMTSLNSACFMRACRTVDPDTAHGREFMAATRVVIGRADILQAQLPMSLMVGCFKQCTVSRDRYFAILGLVDEASEGKAHELQVDYTSPIRDITIRFWKRALQLDSGAELMLIAGLAGKSEGYPSWLRDITVPNPLHCIWLLGPSSDPWHKTGGDLGTWSAIFSDDDPDQMISQGYFVDTIAEVSDVEADQVFQMHTMILWFVKAVAFFNSGHEVAESSTDKRYLLTGEHVHDAAIKTVCDFNSQDGKDGSFTAIHHVAQSLLKIAASYVEKDEDMREAITEFVVDNMDVFTDLFTRILSTRGLRLCKTEKRMFAMLPKEVRVGDSVWVLKGCRLPAVMRPSLAFAASHELVGWGSLYGIMNGEVMQAPGFQWAEVLLR